jgi:hypothetical protein
MALMGTLQRAVPLHRLALILPTLFAVVFASSALANSTRVTRGDAEAIFQGAFNGGWAVRLHSDNLAGAPADFLADSLARLNNGRHYCVLDWHLFNVAIVEGNKSGETFTNQEIFARLASRRVEYEMDGAPMETIRTPPKRTTNPTARGFVEAFVVSEGQILAPEELSVGQHVLTGRGNRAGGPLAAFPAVTFIIDAAGTGTCGPDDALTFRKVQ